MAAALNHRWHACKRGVQHVKHVPTWNVDECPGLKRSWDVQDASKHAMDGSQVSELPVSKQPVKGLAGVPMLNSP